MSNWDSASFAKLSLQRKWSLYDTHAVPPWNPIAYGLGVVLDTEFAILMHTIPAIRELTATGSLAELARSVLGNDARPVKATFFDKAAGANWMVPCRQDITITVRLRTRA